jgi:DNA-binding GntR family transcriptional regulator
VHCLEGAVSDATTELQRPVPLYMQVVRQLRAQIASGATEENTATAADPETAATLGIEPGSPVLLTRTSYYTTTGQIIGYAEAFTAPGNRHTRTYTITGN